MKKKTIHFHDYAFQLLGDTPVRFWSNFFSVMRIINGVKRSRECLRPQAERRQSWHEWFHRLRVIPNYLKVSYNFNFLAKPGGSASKINMVQRGLDLQFHLRYHSLSQDNKMYEISFCKVLRMRIPFLNSGLKVREL